TELDLEREGAEVAPDERADEEGGDPDEHERRARDDVELLAVAGDGDGGAVDEADGMAPRGEEAADEPRRRLVGEDVEADLRPPVRRAGRCERRRERLLVVEAARVGGVLRRRVGWEGGVGHGGERQHTARSAPGGQSVAIAASRPARAGRG